jgi:hypothetical protein
MPPSGDQASVVIPCFRVKLAQRMLREERMELDLIHRRYDSGLLHQVLEMPLAEVRDADRASAAFGVDLLDRLVRRDRRVEVGRDGVVQQEQVEVVEAEAAEAALEADESLVVAVVADHSFVVTNNSPRSMPAARMPSPTSRSLSYEAAVSINRPSAIAVSTAAVVSSGGL